MALSQSLQQKLLQRLSPQQIQLMKLLQIPTANLDERIKEELEENPALEVGEEGREDDFAEREHQEEFDAPEDEYDGSEDDYGNIDISDYVNDGDDEVADYKMRDENYGDTEEQKTIPLRVETTLHDLLVDQLGMLSLDERRLKIAEQIVGSVDDDGYLRRELSSVVDDLAFRQNIDSSEAEVEDLIKLIQQFDPPGVCARNLQECLMLQLMRQQVDGRDVALAIKIVDKYFDEFTKKHYEKIQRGLNISDEELKEVINLILKLNPRPGGNVGEINKAESYIIPDFFIINNAGKLELTLNSKNAPDLRISEGYRDMLKEYDRGAKKDKRQKEAVLFIKQKIDSAKWFIDAIRQRQNTLYVTMHAIMEQQHSFFMTGDETTLRPMI